MTSALVLAALSLVAPVRLTAQADTLGDTTSLETCCRRDRATLAHHPTGDAYLHALRGIQSCGAMAGEVLAQQWRHPPADTAALTLLGGVSANVRDKRVYLAARRIATSRRVTTNARLATIVTLVAHADSTVRLSYNIWPKSPVDARPNVGFGHPLHSLDHASPDAPLPSSVWSDVVSLLARLGESDPNDDVRTMAEYVAKRLRTHLY